jgi:hypothetical protein
MIKKRAVSKQKNQASPALRPTAQSAAPTQPNPYTLFRLANVTPEARQAFEKEAGKRKATLWQQRHEELQQIRRAQTAAELINYASLGVGLLGVSWHHKAREIGDEIIPLISERLKTVSGLPDARTRAQVVETLVGELRWRGEAGAEVLLARFEGLDYFGRGLACVALGLLGAEAAAGKIWRFYEKVLPQKDSLYLVGALWGLIDLKDSRAAEALVYLVSKPRHFYELFGFVARAGDERVILPLMKLSMAAGPQGNQEAMLALASVGYRIGREALISTIERISSGDDDPETSSEKVADMILSSPPWLVQQYFSPFYEGLAYSGSHASVSLETQKAITEPVESLQEGQTI